jgi:uncharacterized protein YdhG (YjbR/CyaY superfamily)
MNQPADDTQTGIMKSTKFKTVGEYFSGLPAKSKVLLQEIQRTIRQAAPEAEEVISYNIPAFRLNGVLVWYAAFKNHIGFYPRTSALAAFKKELSIYKRGKGSVQFALDQPLPLDLIRRIVLFRINENGKSKQPRAGKH